MSYWQADKPDAKTTIDLTLQKSVDLCPTISNDERRRKRSTDAVHQEISGLKPYTNYAVAVSVVNTKFAGSMSDSVEFKTEESGKNEIAAVLVQLRLVAHSIR